MKKNKYLLILTLLFCHLLFAQTKAPDIFLPSLTGKQVYQISTPLLDKDSVTITQKEQPAKKKIQFDFEYNGQKIKITEHRKVIPLQDSLITSDSVFVISDIEGNFRALYDLLFHNHIINKKGQWIYGKNHLVIAGDLVDRGHMVNECLYLIYKLEEESYQAGGSVHYLLGNHDLMVLTGDMRYVHPVYSQIAEKQGRKITDFYSEHSFIGKWMQNHNSILKVNNTIILHAGISEVFSDHLTDIPMINLTVRSYLKDRQTNEQTRLILGGKGILWYRGMMQDYKEDKKINQQSFDKILNRFQADKLVTGHTIVEDICTDYEGRLICIDVHHQEDEPEGILIKGQEIVVRNAQGKSRPLK